MWVFYGLHSQSIILPNMGLSAHFETSDASISLFDSGVTSIKYVFFGSSNLREGYAIQQQLACSPKWSVA